jgi:hypothetical protein
MKKTAKVIQTISFLGKPQDSVEDEGAIEQLTHQQLALKSKGS